MGKYYLVPQKNAHVWVEAYVKEKGWVRIDPTPGSFGMFSSLSKANIFQRVNLLLDTINYYWFAFVISYNLEKQMNILFTLRTAFQRPRMTWAFNKKISPNSLIILLLVTGSTFTAVYITVRILKRGGPVERRLLSSFLTKMERMGYRKRDSQGLEEFAAEIRDSGVRGDSFKFIRAFENLYFKDKPFSANDTRQLKGLIKTI